MCLYVCVYIYIYIHIQRSSRQPSVGPVVILHPPVGVRKVPGRPADIYIYIYRERERERYYLFIYLFKYLCRERGII